MNKDKRSLDYGKAIKESEDQLEHLERHQSKALLRDRTRFLRLLKTGECTSQAKAGKYIGLKLRASEKLWSKYCHEGLSGLLSYPYKGSKGKLSEAERLQLQQELGLDQMQSLRQVGGYIEQQFGVQYTTAGIHYLFERLKVKNKTGRPVHINKDEQGEKVFKKKE
jgi:transposase